MIRRRTITSYEWRVATGNETVVLLNCVKSFFRRLELIGGTEQLTTTGKNLFDIKKASDASNYITTETLAKIDITAAIVFDVKKNTNYCLSVSGKTEQPSINFNIANDVQRKSIFNKLKTEETLNSLDSGKIYVGFSGGDTELNATKLSQEYFDIQLEEASSKTPYEPYTGLKPSPSPEYPQEIKSVGKYDEASGKYLIDVKVTGKNLVPHVLDFMKFGNNDPKTIVFDEKTNSYKLEMRSDNFNQVMCYIKLELKKGTYIIGRKIKIDGIDISSLDSFRILNADTKEVLPCSFAGTKRTFELKNDTNVAINIGHFTNKKQSEAIIYDLQLEYGDTPTPYEPYKEQTLTLTSDRPITKWDRLVEQGGQIGWLYGTVKITLTGNEKWIAYSVHKSFYTIDYDILSKPNPYCTHYIYGNPILSDSNNVFAIGAGAYYNSLWIKDNRFNMDLQDFKAYLSDAYTKGDPVTVLYNSKTTEFIPLSESVQAQLQALHSENGTTHIFVDSGEVPCGINVEYKTKS